MSACADTRTGRRQPLLSAKADSRFIEDPDFNPGNRGYGLRQEVYSTKHMDIKAYGHSTNTN